MHISIKVAPLLFLLLFACKKKCEDRKVGAVELNAETKKYVPYSDDETITFVDELGNEMDFTNEVVNEDYRICTKYTCEPIDPYKPKNCEYYEAYGVRNLLYSDNDTLLIELVISTSNYEEESKLFYDFFSANMSSIGQYVRGEFVPYVHFSDPVFTPNMSIINDPFIEVDEITLNGKEYSDILKSEEGEHMIYFKKNMGVIAFKLSGKMWFLK